MKKILMIMILLFMITINIPSHSMDVYASDDLEESELIIYVSSTKYSVSEDTPDNDKYKWSYTPKNESTPAILSLLSGGGFISQIKYSGTDDLIIRVYGKRSMMDIASYAGNIIIEGEDENAELSMQGGSSNTASIVGYNDANITLQNVLLNMDGNACKIRCENGNIIVNDSELNISHGARRLGKLINCLNGNLIINNSNIVVEAMGCYNTENEPAIYVGDSIIVNKGELIACKGARSYHINWKDYGDINDYFKYCIYGNIITKTDPYVERDDGISWLPYAVKITVDGHCTHKYSTATFGDDRFTCTKCGYVDDDLKEAAEAEDLRLTNEAKELINALPDKDSITLEDKDAIELAEKKYYALSKEQRLMIDEELRKKILEAEGKLDSLLADETESLINNLPAIDNLALSDKTAIEEARASYEALTDKQKELIDEETLKKLTDSEDAMEQLIANGVKEKIDNIPSKDEMTEADKTDVEEARASYEALTVKQKELIDGDTLNKLIDSEKTLSWIIDGISIDENNFPDSNFREFLKYGIGYGEKDTDAFYFDADRDGKLTKSECDRVIRFIVDSTYNIKDISGIKYFEKIKYLAYGGCNARTIDISGNKMLEELVLYDNSFKRLDCSNNTELKYIFCANCGLSSIDISKNTKLVHLYCQNNSLNEVKISDCGSLQYLDCSDNNIESLDLKNNTDLCYLYCQNNSIKSISLSTCEKLVKLNCSNNNINGLELSNCNKLEEIKCNDNLLGSMDLKNKTELKFLYCQNNNIDSIDLSECKRLKYLDCGDNDIAELLLSDCTWLERLRCANNSINRLEIKGCRLITLICFGNYLSEIDITGTKLKNAYIYRNKFDSLNDGILSCDEGVQIVSSDKEEEKEDDKKDEKEESQEDKKGDNKEESGKSNSGDEKKSSNDGKNSSDNGGSKKTDNSSKYKNEWVNGKWYDEFGNQTYAGTLSWKSNATGWWVEDSAGWYPQDSWQKIDGVWYYFKPDGYMAMNEYFKGYWFNSDGSWDSQYLLSWKCNATGWWVEDISGWWPSSSWLKIDGYWYYFDASGYMVTSQYVDGWWISADGVCY